MNVSSSKTVLSIGFATMLVFLGVITLFSLNYIQTSSDQIEQIMEEQKEAELIFKMRDSAYVRTLILHRMALLQDPFERDSEYMKFKEKATEFIIARDSLRNMGMHADEEAIWLIAKELIKNGYLSQKTTVDLLLDDEVDDAIRVLIEEVTPRQKEVMSELTKLMGLKIGVMQEAGVKTIKTNKEMFWLIMVLGSATLIIGVFVTVFVIRTSNRNEFDLITAKEEALSANQYKSLFLANMSHEIRTPLTAIIGYAESMLEERLSPTEKNEYVGTIVRNGIHLLQIINDILDLSKIEANKLDVEIIRVSPVSILAELESIMGHIAREKGLAFNVQYLFPIPDKIDSDPTRLKQILLNVVSNAIKFTNNGGITVNCIYDNHANKMEFIVSDTGIGMSDEAIERIFNPFAQADASTTRKYGGTGLGLTISKELANRLGGELTCSSTMGRGTKFTLTINPGDVEDSDLLYSLPEGWSSSNEHNKTDAVRVSGKVLLAEDSPDIQRLVTMYLKRTGAKVVAVENGQLAIEAALADDYDLILMDMQMPVMDGVQATRWLRSTGYEGNIVALTANAMKEDREKYLEAGVNEFLAKPIDLPQFYKTIADYLTLVDSPQITHKQETAISVNSDEVDSFEDLVCKFKEGLPALMIEFADALEANDDASLRKLAHKLKGMGGSFGFQEITELSAKIETLAQECSLREANDIVTELNVLCHKIASQ